MIINADDCGYNHKINGSIEKAIIEEKITSTTVMANMYDLLGSVSLYKTYHDIISFGCHLNLTEGCPLLGCSLLLEKGFYKEENGKVVFNGKSFFHKPLSRDMKTEIKKELSAQIECLMDHGIQLTHIDSHHHIHTSITLMSVIGEIAKKYHISKMRRMRNFVPMSPGFFLRQGWAIFEKKMAGGVKMTDYFCSYSEYFDNITLKNKIGVLELECHPGGNYPEEEKLLFSQDLRRDYQLMSYKDL